MIESCQTDFTIYCSFAIFQKGAQTIEINLVGAILPILVSLLFLILLRGRYVLRVTKYSLLLCALFTLVWSVTDHFEGGISTPGPLVVILLYGVSLVWLYFNPNFVSRDTVNSTVLQTYITGTFGFFLADALRIMASLFRIPVFEINAPLLVIGGAGPDDAVLMGGLMFIIMFLFAWSVLRILKERYQFEFGRRKLDVY